MNQHTEAYVIEQTKALYESVKSVKKRDIDAAAIAIHRGADQTQYNHHLYDPISEEPSDNRQRSALQEAVHREAVHKEPELLHLLLAHGADVHEYNDKAIRTLAGIDLAARGLSVLIQHGADVNANQGEPLLNAVLRGDKEQIDVLVFHGADVNLVTRERVEDHLRGSGLRQEYLDHVKDKLELLEIYQSPDYQRHVPGQVRRMDLSFESREQLSAAHDEIQAEKDILDAIVMKNEIINDGFMVESYEDFSLNHEDYYDELRQAAFDEFWDGETPEEEFKEECWQSSCDQYKQYLEQNTVRGAIKMGPDIAEDIKHAQERPRENDELTFDVNKQLIESIRRSSDTNAVDAWLSFGADAEYDGGRPLIEAAAYGKNKMVQTLLDHGAEPTSEAIHAAQKGGHRDTAEIIQGHYEQDLLRRHLPQVSQSDGLSQTPQPSRRQRL